MKTTLLVLAFGNTFERHHHYRGYAMYASKLLLCLSLTFCVLAFGADTEVNPVRRQPPETAEGDVYKVIVKFREDGLGVAARQSGMTQAQSGKDRAVAVVHRAGLMLKGSHEMVAGMHALRVQTLSSHESLATTLARLRADPAVEYAEPDYRRHIHATPDDPVFQDCSMAPQERQQHAERHRRSKRLG